MSFIINRLSFVNYVIWGKFNSYFLKREIIKKNKEMLKNILLFSDTYYPVNFAAVFPKGLGFML